MNLCHHPVWIGKALGIKRFLPPQVSCPGVPIQDNAVEGQSTSSVLFDDFD